MTRTVFADAFRTLAAAVRRRGMRRTDVRLGADLCAEAVTRGYTTEASVHVHWVIAPDDADGYATFLEQMADAVGGPLPAADPPTADR